MFCVRARLKHSSEFGSLVQEGICLTAVSHLTVIAMAPTDYHPQWAQAHMLLLWVLFKMRLPTL